MILSLARNLNQLLDTDRDELYQSLAAGNSKKSEQGQEVVFMLENLISNADLITSGRMMGVKKGRLYNLFQLEEEMKRLSESLRNEKFQEEEGVEEDSDPGVEAETEMVEESKVEEDSNWFMPIIRYQVDILYVIAMACSIRWQGLTENKKPANTLKKKANEPERVLLRSCSVHWSMPFPMKKIFLKPGFLPLFRIWAEAGLFMAESCRDAVKCWNLNLHFT